MNTPESYPPLYGDPDALGRNAVDAAHEHAAQICAMRPSFGEDSVYGKFLAQQIEDKRELVEARVGDIRQELRDMSWWRRNQLAGSLALGEMPESLQDMLHQADGRQKTTDRAILKRLLAADGKKGYRVSSGTMLNVLQWHNQRLSDEQVRFDTEVAGPLKESFKGQVQQAVSEGWMPEEALERLDRIDETKVYKSDGSVVSARGCVGEAGRKENGEHYILVHPESPEGAAEHELTHIIEGSNFAPLANTPTEVTDIFMSASLAQFFREGNQATNLLQEAVTDFISDSLRHGYTGNVDKRARFYPHGWALLKALSTYGVKQIDPQLFVKARMEDTADQIMMRQINLVPWVDQLRQELVEAFPHRDILEDLANTEAPTPLRFQIRVLRLAKVLEKEHRARSRAK